MTNLDLVQMKKHKNEVLFSVNVGTVVVDNLNLWNGGSNNIYGKDQKMIIIIFCYSMQNNINLKKIQVK